MTLQPRSTIPSTDNTVGNNQRNTGDNDNRHTQHDTQQAGIQNHVQVDGVTQREAEEWDQNRGRFAEEVTQVVVEVAEGKTDQERQDGADKVVRFKEARPAEPRISMVTSGPDSRDISTKAPDSSLVPY